MGRTSGTYAAPTNSFNPAVDGTAIDVSDWNDTLTDIESALTESVYTAGLGAFDGALLRTDGTDTKKARGSTIIVDSSGNTSGITKLTMSGALVSTESSVTLGNGANSDIVLPSATFCAIIGPSGVFNITGFASPVSGQLVELYNSTSQNMTITNDAGSTTTNRILTLTGADVALTGTSYARFRYSAVSSRWILTGTQG